MTDSAWQPGDPLHRDPRVGHQSGIFGFRYDLETEHCSCPDAASWSADPTTPVKHPLGPVDGVETFILEHRLWVAEGRPHWTVVA